MAHRLESKPGGKNPEPTVPPDLREALALAAKAKATWTSLTPIARRDFTSWIDSAKQAETRTRRIERACSMLASGKRRPCCYTIVSFNLFTALKANPKAKAGWSKLGSDERRDLIAWMDADKEPAAHQRRIEQGCAQLATGKRRKSS